MASKRGAAKNYTQGVKESLCGSLIDAVKTSVQSSVDGAFQELFDKAKKKFEEECAGLLAEAEHAAAETKAAAEERAAVRCCSARFKRAVQPPRKGLKRSRERSGRNVGSGGRKGSNGKGALFPKQQGAP